MNTDTTLKSSIARWLPVFLALVAWPVTGATQVTRHVSVLPVPNPAGLTDLNDVILFRSSHSGVQAFDGALDPDAYIVGPGDHFEINIWSPLARNFLLIVTPEGTLLIPSVGEIELAGRTLHEARELILAATMEAFPNGDISATLTETRRVRVHVSGLVKAPGTYELYASQRLAFHRDV